MQARPLFDSDLDGFRDSVNKFFVKEAVPFHSQWEKDGQVSKELWRKAGEMGFLCPTAPEEFGGVGADFRYSAVVMEEASALGLSGVGFSLHSDIVMPYILRHGTEAQKQHYIPKLISGEMIGAIAMTEPGAGSDLQGVKTTAIKKGDKYILNGSKMWITSGGIAKTYIVMARTGGDGAKGVSAFIVEDGTEGFSFGKKEKKMGWKASPTREVLFQNCFIPEENLLQSEGMGFKIALSALSRGRITIGSIAVGLAQRALDEAVKYSLDRKQFNQPIFDFQGLQFMMTDMATEIECSRLLVEEAAKNFDSGVKNQKVACMAKLKATDTAMKVTTDAVQVLGGVGYTSEYPVERFMRDAKLMEIGAGTSEIRRMLIGREMMGAMQ